MMVMRSFRPMNAASQIVLRLILVLMLVFVLDSCIGRRITPANVDQVTEGMSKKQVESILGPPTSVETKDFLLLKRTTYVYRQSNGTVTVLFKDDKVAAKIPAELERQVNAAIAQYPAEHKRSAALPLLHLWQEHFGFITDEGIKW